jgi:hypothetical protein
MIRVFVISLMKLNKYLEIILASHHIRIAMIISTFGKVLEIRIGCVLTRRI